MSTIATAQLAPTRPLNNTADVRFSPQPSTEFHAIAQQLTAGPQTLEYFVAYSIERYSRDKTHPNVRQQ
ncbi:hypothetical protein [Timonella sp. A28]|uniref:hypothetical protein n=1 Tax=Timonella sp. A28 TaxID=3442640 RepID=UPI003EBED639